MAPLGGLICKVLVDPGQVVGSGEPVLLLEAMKMETTISAPVSGTVGALKVAEGDSVAVGDTLMTIV